MRLVILESPYRGEVARNVAYAWTAMRDCLNRHEAPLASHLIFPQFLDDDDPAERGLGIAAGLAWGRAADATVVYIDHGISDGMRLGIAQAEREKRPVEFRSLNGDEKARDEIRALAQLVAASIGGEP